MKKTGHFSNTGLLHVLPWLLHVSGTPVAGAGPSTVYLDLVKRTRPTDDGLLCRPGIRGSAGARLPESVHPAPGRGRPQRGASPTGAVLDQLYV